jgi:hypothetical protein
MTEEEWLMWEDPVAALEWFRTGLSERKLRLLACSCWEIRALQVPENPNVPKACERASKYADGLLPFTELLPDSMLSGRNAWYTAMSTIQVMVRPDVEFLPGLPMQLLRDIFGNPFRPITPNPSWLTSTVVSLANGIYVEKAFDRMPILADALQDAGCDNEDILNHCRQPGEHVRGCFVVDSLLGKS